MLYILSYVPSFPFSFSFSSFSLIFFLLYDAELIIHQLSQHGITPVRSDRSHCIVSLNYNSSTASLPSSFLPPAKLFLHWLQALCLDNPPSLTKDSPTTQNLQRIHLMDKYQQISLASIIFSIEQL